MNPAAKGAEEWPFEVDAKDFRAGMHRLVLQRDVTRDALGAPADVLGAGRDGCRNIRGGAVGGNGSGDSLERVFSAFHDIVAAGAAEFRRGSEGAANMEKSRGHEQRIIVTEFGRSAKRKQAGVNSCLRKEKR